MARDGEVERLWPAIRAAHLMSSPEELRAFRAAGPWRVLITERGEAALIDRWRAHMDACAIRGLWSSPARVPGLVGEIRAAARAQGFHSVLSPLLSAEAQEPYRAAEMDVAQDVVALQAPVGWVRAPGLEPPGIRTRAAAAADLTVLSLIDSACFDEFWRYGLPELETVLASERVMVAETRAGTVVGYSTTVVRGATATVGRLAVDPGARRGGVGATLLEDAARWAERTGATTLSLCTQRDNHASRAMYARCGLEELDSPYALLTGSV